MKKIFLYTLTLLAAAFAFSSCNNEEDLIFEDSAANRLDKAKAEYAELLVADGGKWVMEYFSNPDEPGVSYVLTFDKNGEVTIEGNNDYIGGSYKSETSLWDIITDFGAVLTFNSYNSIFHVFADPDPSNGLGYEGDYEFIFLSTSEDGNTIYLKGKKHSHPVTLKHLSAETDGKAYLQTVADRNENLFSQSIEENVLTMPDGTRFIVLDGMYGVISMYPEGGDPVSQTETGNVLINDKEMYFMEPFHVSLAGAPSDSVTFKHFVIQPDGSLLCDDEYSAGAVITSPDLDVLFTTYNWNATADNATGFFKTVIENLESQLKAKTGSLQNVYLMGYDATDGTALSIKVRIKEGLIQQTRTLNFYFKHEMVDGKLKLEYTEANSFGAKYLPSFPAIQDFIDYLEANPLALEADNRLNTQAITVTGASGDRIVVTL